MDKDMGAFNKFMGLISLPLKEVLASLPEPGEERVFRCARAHL
jgi:hypothetical protein